MSDSEVAWGIFLASIGITLVGPGIAFAIARSRILDRIREHSPELFRELGKPSSQDHGALGPQLRSIGFSHLNDPRLVREIEKFIWLEDRVIPVITLAIVANTVAFVVVLCLWP